MGSSVSGHFSHGHRARFKRVDNNSSDPLYCRMCQQNVGFGAAAYRCSEPRCAFLLHDACYRRPKTIRRHFEHPQHGLTLDAIAAGASLSCSLCAQPLGARAFAYSCMHRPRVRCCSLRRDIPSEHVHGRLVLRPPPGGGRPRSCKKHAAAWSYQYTMCDDAELCLPCLLSNNDRRRGGTVRCCCDPETVEDCLGRAAGAFLRALWSGMGCPDFTAK